MSTIDDGLLAVRFAALAPEPLPGSWADVVGRVGRPRTDLGRSRSPRRTLVVALAIVAVVAVLSASALAVRAFVIGKGFIGVPPVGATPSTPKSGKLVLSAWGHARGSRTILWVYADGRFIWQRENPKGADLAVSANRLSSGVLEQRLTERGVRMLRSTAFATGLFGHNAALTFDDQPCLNFIKVWTGARFSEARWSGSQCLIGADPPTGTRPATAKEAFELRRLFERLAYPTSWLPASAWRDRRMRAFVPATFQLEYGPWPRNATLADPLERLPAKARELLRSKKAVQLSVRVGTPGNLVPGHAYRFRVSVELARQLHSALARAGLEVDEDYVLAYHVKGQHHPNAGATSIAFTPVLPDRGLAAVGG